jgi:hypothetical protein
MGVFSDKTANRGQKLEKMTKEAMKVALKLVMQDFLLEFRLTFGINLLNINTGQ